MQRYFSDCKIDNKLKLIDDDMYHIKTVMRMNNSDLIEVVYDEKLYICKVNLNSNLMEIDHEEISLDDKMDVTLVIPLLKENKMDLIMQKSAELGVTRIIPVNMERSIIKLDNEKYQKKRERWQKICKEASEQSKRTSIPIVTNLTSLDTLEGLKGVKLVCSTQEKEKNIKFYFQSLKKYATLVLVIGPEGGLTPKEEDTLVNIGFNRVSLGKRIMRVETVPLFLLSIINYVNME